MVHPGWHEHSVQGPEHVALLKLCGTREPQGRPQECMRVSAQGCTWQCQVRAHGPAIALRTATQVRARQAPNCGTVSGPCSPSSQRKLILGIDPVTAMPGPPSGICTQGHPQSPVSGHPLLSPRGPHPLLGNGVRGSPCAFIRSARRGSPLSAAALCTLRTDSLPAATKRGCSSSLIAEQQCPLESCPASFSSHLSLGAWVGSRARPSPPAPR